MATDIDDLGDMLIVEILCRLSSYKSVVRSKLVSKRWYALISDSYFIDCFSRLQSDKQTHKTHGVVDSYGNELFPTQFYEIERFRSSLGSWPPQLLATCNDLVLGVLPYKEPFLHDDYYICNPRTMQLVRLPPTRRQYNARIGFICEPYYNETGNAGFNINPEYRCRVVRIHYPRGSRKCLKINIEVFSSETGEWREIVVPCPQGFTYSTISRWLGFGKNGILYWVGDGSLPALRTPFMINKMNGTSSSIIDDDDDLYEFHVIELDSPVNHSKDCSLHEEPPLLCVWELKEEELDQMVVKGVRKLGSEHMKSYFLDRKMIPKDSDYSAVRFIAYNFNDLDVVYVSVGTDTVKCNIQTGSWSKIAEKTTRFHDYYQFVLPWWPTPVPRIHRAQYVDLYSHRGIHLGL